MVLISSSPAWAQADAAVACTASAAAAPVRAAGVAEMLPDILLSCVPVSPLPPGPRDELSVSITVTLNASVTNTISSGTFGDISDAVLVVNGNDCAMPSANGSTYGSCDAPLTTVQDPQFGRLVGVNALTWTNVSVPFPGNLPFGASTLKIRGIRANASQVRLAGGSSFGAPVAAALELRSPSGVALRNASLRLANSLTGMRLAVVETEPAAACGGDSRGTATVVVQEGFASAFRAGSQTALPGEATRVMLDIRDVPEGVELRIPSFVACHQPDFDGSDGASSESLALALVSGHDAAGAGGSAAASGTGTDVSILLEDGVGRAVYEVVADDPGQVEDCHIPALFETSDRRVGSARATVAASFAPRSAVPRASASAPLPRFAPALALAGADVNLGACSTRLLFPFVTNQAGFDTGLVITHGSLQALTDTVAEQAGSCDLHFYGVGGDGEDELLVQYTTAIEPGEQLVFTFSGGNPARNIIGMDQFQGYLIADCGFPGARGYVFMSDGFGGIADLAMGYLAPVIPFDAEGRRLPIGGDAP
ncbi:MAG: hypothetical protein F4X77_10160 [Acidobacteriia bacterium]|nr:hypothetical protein [Terriglobia bacterium]